MFSYQRSIISSSWNPIFFPKNILSKHNMDDDDELISKNITHFVIASNRDIKFLISLPLQISSILCSLFIFLKVLCQPEKLLKPIGNHFIFVLLMTSFIQVTTELSMVENYLHTGIIRPSTNSYCLFFNWYEFSLNGISLFVSKLNLLSFLNYLFYFSVLGIY